MKLSKLTLGFEVQCDLLSLKTLRLAPVHGHGHFYGLNEGIPISIVLNDEVVGPTLQLQADALPAIEGFFQLVIIVIFGRTHFCRFW